MKKGHKEMYTEMMGHLMKKLYKKGGKKKEDDKGLSAKSLPAEPAPDGEKLEEDDVEVSPKSKKRSKGKMVVGFGGK